MDAPKRGIESRYTHEVIHLSIDYMDGHVVADFSDLVRCIEHCLIILIPCSFMHCITFHNNLRF